jgi:putative ABC transport system ATP-binding protein
LTPGQLVASELVVTVIVGAFAKIHKSLETFFDLMASTDKVGHILDLPLDVPPRPLRITNANGSLAWSNLVLNDEITHTHIELGSAEIRSGQRVALVSETTDHPSRLLSYLAGLEDAVTGYAEISGIDSRDACRSTLGQIVGYAGQVEVFHGTLMENLTLLCPRVSIENVYWALELVGLKDTLLQLSSGLETELESGGHPLSYDQRNRLMIARAIIGRPRVLMIDRVLDGIPFALASELKQKLCDRSIEWTVLLVSNNPALTEGMDIIRFPKH